MPLITHPLHPLDEEPMDAMRAAMVTFKGSITGPDFRAFFDQMMEGRAAAPGVAFAEATIGGVKGWWCRPAGAAADAALLYLHGGAYVVGSARAYRHFVSQIAARTGIAAFIPDYGLAPEFPFPAAIEDAYATYCGLAGVGVARIALVGDSAGGGLALALQALLATGAGVSTVVPPMATAVMSPWTDLALTGATMETRAEADPLSTREALNATARLYLGSVDPRNPRVSPLYADAAGLPPIRMDVGEDEILLADSTRYGEQVEQAGGQVEIHMWQGMAHVFPSSFDMLVTSREALDSIATFLRMNVDTAARNAGRRDCL